ncbi:MAG: alkaline phosphatase D family protein [Actinomycetota bacterium]
MSRAWSAHQPIEEPFAHGVASGDPLADGVLLWTRVTPASEAHELSWAVARDPDLDHVVREGRAPADPDHDGTVTIEVSGLEPATTYYYAFELEGRRSAVGRTRTLPRGGCERLRLAVTSCAKFTAGHFTAYGRIADRPELDFWLHLGDYIYEYPTDDGKAVGPGFGRTMSPPHECRTLADYRTRYAHYRTDPDLLRLHLTHPIIATLDDHEFCNDTWREGAKNHDPAEDGPWAERKAAGLRAWAEWLPVRVTPRGTDVRIFRRFELGALADLILLDGRTRRDEMTKDPEVLEHPERTLLGAEQFEWLATRLRGSEAAWRLIGNGVMLGQVSTDFMPEEVGDPLSELGILTAREHGPNPDQWDGYPAERGRLFDVLEDHGVQDVVFLSGDVHSSWAVELRRDPGADGAPLAVEFVTTSVTSENLDEEMKLRHQEREFDIEADVLDNNPHIRFVELDNHGYMLLEVTPELVCCEWRYVDILERSGADRLGARWETRRGDPKLIEHESRAGRSDSAS